MKDLARLLPFFLSVVFTASCAGNSVQKISDDGTFVKKDSSGRYNNTYKGFEDYPFTCEKDCYQPHPDVQCEEESLNECKYVGDQLPNATEHGISITWLGHASFRIVDSKNQQFLIDPVSRQFDWPVNWAHSLTGGFTRKPPKWLDSETLRQTDAVLYSHLHYDHFSKSDIAEMGNHPRYFVHQDTASYLPDDDLSIYEMAWFAEYSLGDTKIHAAPAHHFNSRFFVPYIYEDNERALWGGWLLEHQGIKVFYAGDTGYSPHFKDIAKRYGDIDICLLPIASYYHPEYSKWYRYVHTTPEDALLAADELGCSVMIPWGYGNASWRMGDRSSHSPLVRLLNMHKLVNQSQTLHIMNEGDTVTF